MTLASLLVVVSGWARTPQTLNDQVTFRHLQVEDGLSHNSVYWIDQDATGFLWFAAEQGLNRYDGYSFEQFVHDPLERSSLSEADTSVVFVDSSDAIWVGTWGGGLNRFDRASETFIRYGWDNDSPQLLQDSRVQVIFEDEQQRLWIGTYDGGLSRFDRQLKRFFSYRHDPANPHSISSDRIWSICQTNDGALWVATDAGLNRLDIELERFTRFLPDPADSHSLPHRTVRAVAVERSGTLWVGTEAGLRYLDGEARFRRLPLSSPAAELLRDQAVNVIMQDLAGTLWVGTHGQGLCAIDPGSGEGRCVARDARRPGSLSGNDIRSLLQDRSGVLWIGTRYGGISMLDLKRPKFEHVKNDPFDDSSLSNSMVWTLTTDRAGTLWVGTMDGLNRYNEESQSFTHYRHRPGDPTSLPSSMVQSVLADSTGTLWVATWEGGLSRFDPVTGSFVSQRHRRDDTNSLPSNRLTRIYESPDSTLWIGTADGLAAYDRARGSFRRFVHDPEQPGSISESFVRSLLVDRRGVLWVGTDASGLNRYDAEPGSFTRFRSIEEDNGSLSNNRVHVIHQDPSGTIWVGTGNGLNRLDTDSGTFQRFYRRDGLASANVCAIEHDDRGFLWISTSGGLSRLDPATGRFRNYRSADGLQGLDFTAGASWRAADGTLYFGGTDGYNKFDPLEVRDNPYPPPIVLRSFRRFDEPMSFSRPLGELTRVDLSYRDNFFTIEYAALDFTNPTSNRYAYQLEGLDPGLVDAGHRRTASYTDVKPGTYLFRVKACNNDGVWNHEGASLVIVIAPPFWATTWFRAAVALALVLTLLAAYRLRVRTIKLQNRRLELLVAERTRELALRRDQLQELNDKKNEFLGIAAHDLRTPLGLVSSWTTIVMRQVSSGNFAPRQLLSDLDRVLRVTRQMSKLVSRLLDISAIEAGKVKLEVCELSMQEILDDCGALHARIADDKQIELSVDRREDLPPVLADRTRIFEVMDNLLSNAIKYTYPGGTVRVSCEVCNGELITHIADSGQGLDEKDLQVVFRSFRKLSARPTGGEPSTGFGLAIVKKIIELHKGRIWVKSGDGQGATFSFALPIAAPARSPSTLPDACS